MDRAHKLLMKEVHALTYWQIAMYIYTVNVLTIYVNSFLFSSDEGCMKYVSRLTEVTSSIWRSRERSPPHHTTPRSPMIRWEGLTSVRFICLESKITSSSLGGSQPQQSVPLLLAIVKATQVTRRSTTHQREARFIREIHPRHRFLRLFAFTSCSFSELLFLSLFPSF